MAPALARQVFAWLALAASLCGPVRRTRAEFPASSRAWLVALARRTMIDAARRRRIGAGAAGHLRMMAEEVEAAAACEAHTPSAHGLPVALTNPDLARSRSSLRIEEFRTSSSRARPRPARAPSKTRWSNVSRTTTLPSASAGP